ncbi:MAG: hypothetical protein QMD99_14945, partial [Rhizobiaceae bacterium]|nr:hypothetical protein [Rhizobiaceae bacterium]
SLVFAGQTAGVKQVEDNIWLASVMDTIWDETCRLEPFEPLRSKSVTYVSGIKRNLCAQNGPKIEWRTRQDSNL